MMAGEYARLLLAVAERQSAKLFELRAATSLARLWRDQGKRTEAHDLPRANLRLVHGRARHAGPARLDQIA